MHSWRPYLVQVTLLKDDLQCLLNLPLSPLRGLSDRQENIVPHIQSEMLRTLLQNKRVNYAEHVYPHTNHVQLHQKKQILNDILKTLWYK